MIEILQFKSYYVVWKLLNFYVVWKLINFYVVWKLLNFYVVWKLEILCWKFYVVWKLCIIKFYAKFYGCGNFYIVVAEIFIIVIFIGGEIFNIITIGY